MIFCLRLCQLGGHPIPLDGFGIVLRDAFATLVGKPEVELSIGGVKAVRTFVEGETPEWFGRFKPGLPLTESGEKGII